MFFFKALNLGRYFEGRTSAMLRMVVFAGAVVAAGQASAATALFEDFSGGLNGWTAEGAEFGVAPTGGPSGAGDAFMFVVDNANTALHATFGNGWTGDLSAYDTGTLSLDFVHPTLVQTSLLSSYGRVTVTGASGSAVADIYNGDPSTLWQTAALGFDATTFGATDTEWSDILSNVQSITIRLESWSGNTETVGIDNVSLAAVPLPASVLFLLGGLGAMFAFRRRSDATA